jgi:hypothetical protein
MGSPLERLAKDQENSLYYSLLSGINRRERFAADCIHRHLVVAFLMLDRAIPQTLRFIGINSFDISDRLRISWIKPRPCPDE